MFQIRTMITYCLVMALLATSARAKKDLELRDFEDYESDPRLFFANFTSSLIQGGSILWLN